MARRNDDYQRELDDLQSTYNGIRRMDPRVQIFVVALVVLAGIAFVIAYLRLHPHQTQPVVGSVQMLLGNPSNAMDDASSRDNYLMIKPYFVLSYNNSKGTPNWVSWRVTAGDLGAAPRKQTFDTDTQLPIGFNAVVTHDYDGSGFDRGHMCPHSDRAADQEMSYATFVMTNIIPQAPNVNRKAWEQLESYCRELVSRDHNRVYITAGPAGQGGRGRNGFMAMLRKGSVVVPAECWKIVVVLPDDGGDDLAKISTGTRVIAVLMPNDQEKVGEEWAKFRTSVAEIEQRSGLRFFDRVRPDIADALRQKVDDEQIPPPRAHHYGD